MRSPLKRLLLRRICLGEASVVAILLATFRHLLLCRAVPRPADRKNVGL
jgi:hypothetical protein